MRTRIGYDAAGRPLYLTPEERKTHAYVIGSSGSGKSKFLEHLIRQDLDNRQGFCLLDPHGTLYDAVAGYAAHHVLRRDIILLNLSEPDWVIGFNPFKVLPGADTPALVDRRITATMHAWNVRTTDETPTLARTLRLIYTALFEQNLTLPQARHLIDFDSRHLRRGIFQGLKTSLVRAEWEELSKLPRKDWRDEVLSAKNRLFKMLASDTLTRFMGVPAPALDIEKIIKEGTVLLVNLRRSDHLSEDNARLFGAFLVNEFFEAAFRRKKARDGRDPKPYHLYLDEFQNFVSFDIADMLDQVRKFGLYLILAHQRFGQVDENVLEAALSHCRIKAVFGGLTVPNARSIAEELFIGKLNPRKVKAAIYQTKFWPQYSRDTVYTKGVSSATSRASGSHSASGSFSGSGSGTYFEAGDWFGPPHPSGGSSMSSSGSSSLSGTSNMESESDMEATSEADIPIFFPVPFKELSSVQYYTLEEQLTELTAALKNQFPRHCFIQIHQRETEPLLVPFVEDYHTPPRNLRWYEGKLLHQTGALSAPEADKLLEARERAFLALADARASKRRAEDVPDDFRE